MPQVVLPRTWRAFEDNLPMDKTELIEAIRAINKTAKPEFLARFSEQELKDYLEHLAEFCQEEVAVAS